MNSAVELAVLDAPVLARGGLTLFLLRLAVAGAFDPVWSDQIHADWSRELLRLRPDLPPERLRQRRVELDRAFPVANVLVSRDAQDEVLAHCTTQAERRGAHVLATALSARAAVIVTDDSFCLGEVMSKVWHDTAVLSPDQWCLELLERHEAAMLEGARAHRAATCPSSPAPPATGPQSTGPMTKASADATWLALLCDPAMGLPRTAERLRALPDRR